MRMIPRRSILSALGVSLPFGLSAGVRAAATPAAPEAPTLRLRPFEEAVRAAFALPSPDDSDYPTRRVEVGDSDQVRSGVQGCYNDRPFAGFPAGHLRFIRVGSEAGPTWQGVRLYISTVEIAVTGGLRPGDPGRPLDFASLPPAPTFA